MADHVLPEDVERFLSGELPAQRSQELLGHLLRGCGQCSTAIAESSGLTASPVPESAYDLVMSKVVGRLSETAVQRQEAIGILTSLLSGERRWTDLSGSEVSSLRELPQLRALLDAGFAQRHHDPQAALRFARLARYAADRLSAREFGLEPVGDLRAFAWAELANAHRICDDLAAAGRAMNRAIYWAARGTRSTLLLARVSDLLASLLAAQRRFTEASELLVLVYDEHAKAGRSHLAGRALFSAANMASWEGNPWRAIVLMHRSLELLDEDRDPGLVSQALLAILSDLAEAGRYRSARRLLWRSRHRIVEHAAEIDLVRLRWLEAKIFAGLGDSRRAEIAFKDARDGFSSHDQFYPAAIAGLDLAALLADQGRFAEVRDLAGEMIATFRAVRIAREAIVTLLILQKACDKGRGQILEVIEMVGSFLRDLERQPARRQEAGRSKAPVA